jgi:hypothetical protein
LGLALRFPPRSEVVLLNTDHFGLCFSQIIFGTACADGNTEAVRNVEKATDSEPVKGEELLESEELKQKLSNEAGVETRRHYCGLASRLAPERRGRVK